MTVTVERACRTAQFHEFHELQIEYEKTLPIDLRHELADVPALEVMYAEPNAAFLAAIDRSAAGCVAVTSLDKTTSVVKRLYVKPEYRQLGIARTLVRAVTQYSRERRHQRVVLDTDRARLNAAYKLYVSLGFIECEPYDSVDNTCPTYMELSLR